MLNLYIDFKSPAAYLAMKPALNLIASTGLAVKWLPFAVKQSVIPIEQQDETKGETHRRVRAEQRQQMHALYAELSNTEMHFPTKAKSTDLALNVLANLTQDPTAFISRAFSAYWVQDSDLNDPAVVEQLVREVGLPFNAELLLPTAMDACLVQALEKGVFDVPAFVFADQMFIGREHMPWLRELAASFSRQEDAQI
jgi:2-hydroxychromene-2-carboxylate isomerase